MEALFSLLFVIPFALFGLMFGVWIWGLVDALQVPADIFFRAGTKVLWGILIGVMGPLAAIVYFAVGRPDRGMREWMAQQRAAGVDLRAYRVYDQPSGFGGGGWQAPGHGGPPPPGYGAPGYGPPGYGGQGDVSQGYGNQGYGGQGDVGQGYGDQSFGGQGYGPQPGSPPPGYPPLPPSR